MKCPKCDTKKPMMLDIDRRSKSTRYYCHRCGESVWTSLDGKPISREELL